jgi:hypothetical protein
MIAFDELKIMGIDSLLLPKATLHVPLGCLEDLRHSSAPVTCAGGDRTHQNYLLLNHLS